MLDNYLVWERDFSIPKILSGYFGIIFGEDFGYHLFKGDFWAKGNRAAQPAENLAPEQEKALGLISAAEIQGTAGQYDSLRKTCHLLFVLAKECFFPGADAKHRDVFLHGLAFSLFSEVAGYLAVKGFAGEALKFYQELLVLFPGDMDAIKRIARTFYTMGPYYLSEAEKIYRQALSADPDDLEVAENLGRVLGVSPGGPEEARLVYRQALLHCRSDMDKLRFYFHLHSISPGDGDILLRMGRLYQRQGMFTEAKDCLEKAKTLHNDPEEKLALAHLYYLLNDLQKAEALLHPTPPGEEESYYLGHFLLGMIREDEERWHGALEYYGGVPPESAYYWKAVAGLARVHLQMGNSPEAEKLARKIPGEQHAALGMGFLELCDLLEKALQRESHLRAEEWRKHINEFLPSFHLKKDVYRRSMGPNFWRKYEALQVLGNGPSGQVLLGRERQKGAQVAIKHLYRDLLGDPLAIRRIQGILKSWRNLEGCGPYLISVYEDCLVEGSFFYAMEYIEHDLASIIKTRGPIPSKIVVEIAMKICDALAYYYSRHMDSLHGGLKPQNIFISANNELKISGFDYLSALEGKRVFHPREIKKRPSFLPSLYYFAPERFKNRTLFDNFRTGLVNSQSLKVAFEGVDKRADLYSLGIILFELVTGFLPFDIQSVEALLFFHKSRHALPLPRLRSPLINPGLEEIIATLTAREPSRRFATPGEVKKALASVYK